MIVVTSVCGAALDGIMCEEKSVMEFVGGQAGLEADSSWHASDLLPECDPREIQVTGCLS